MIQMAITDDKIIFKYDGKEIARVVKWPKGWTAMFIDRPYDVFTFYSRQEAAAAAIERVINKENPTKNDEPRTCGTCFWLRSNHCVNPFSSLSFCEVLGTESCDMYMNAVATIERLKNTEDRS